MLSALQVDKFKELVEARNKLQAWFRSILNEDGSLTACAEMTVKNIRRPREGVLANPVSIEPPVWVEVAVQNCLREKLDTAIREAYASEMVRLTNLINQYRQAICAEFTAEGCE